MEEVIFTANLGGLMVVAFEPRCGSKEHEFRVQIGDYSDMDSFVPKHEFTLLELPIVTRLLNMAYPAIFAKMREG